MSTAENRRKLRLSQLRQFAEENNIPVQNIQLLNTALTHTSYANEHRSEVIHDNERLEFLGDAVLDLVVGEYLFLRFPTWPEGELTRAKASAVCKPACAECAAKFHIGDYMRLGRGEEMSGAGRASPFWAMLSRRSSARSTSTMTIRRRPASSWGI